MIRIFYRHYNISGSDNKDRPNWFDFEKCFVNLLSTLEDSVELHVVMDGDINNNFIGNYKNKYILHTIDAKNDQISFWETYKIAKTINSNKEDLFYFLENDYMHINGWVQRVKALFNQHNYIDYVSLYDHNDKYFFPMYRFLKSTIITTTYNHWRTTPSTCGTFIVNQKILNEDFQEHTTIPGDHEKFIHLSVYKNRQIFTPIPGLSTHCMNGLLSPTIEWSNIL